ncbi:MULTISPECIES: hypothetical protein [unclassified Halomonas]|uniref:hypothetical protein n=1 Tax=unclassified Halomonas TaxID=2609666 RepID=UPI0007D9B9F4|nr:MULTISPECIES: hypothetical protein [unclassified Halomonas]MBT2788915.1 hypothetical protein [Halomonas sp. ISL-106]MBT2799156.1 hypothetical protein [Halomonas sp. ISL-104]OAL60211.1 hypothetical protein A6R74_20275 [Halomonas sp. ALS9]
MSNDVSFYQEDPAHIAAAKVRSSQDYDTFVEGVYGLIEYVKMICQTSNNIIYSSEGAEDSITHSIVNYLRPFNANIGMKQSGGGNADIVIANTINRLKWVGEAKILSDDTDNGYVFEGLLQLCTRYSNACKTEQHGGVLIYNFKERLDRCVLGWDKFVFEKAPEHDFDGFKKVNLGSLNTFSGFFTEHKHHATGEMYTVAHIPINFFKRQLDKSARNRKSV